ncbi:MAG: MFS transporter [Alphaproteobacteria bacterium]|nr:MFS transporter [Alphaproteobacteria bacterium]
MNTDPRTRRNVLLLASCQALMMTGASLTMTVSALVGHELAADKSLSTLPLALQFFSTMLATIPASMLMKQIGRRAGFSIGVAIGMVGAGTATWGVLAGNFWTFALGGIPLGVFNGFGQFYRFAAADTAPADYRARAISYVLAGGIVAAIAGPELAQWSKDWLAPIFFAGSFASILALQAAALALLQFLDIPVPDAASRASRGRPILHIARNPTFVVAVLGGMVGYASMNFVMTATPLAMVVCGHSFGATKLVMQVHALGMFVPSFFTGTLIRRFGVLEVMLAGAALLAGCIAINATGVSEAHFLSALLLLGLGWNFLYVGASTLLIGVAEPAERNKVQAANDFLVFGLVSLSAYSSGALHEWLGWQPANLGILPLIAVAALAAGWLRLRNLKQAAPA